MTDFREIRVPTSVSFCHHAFVCLFLPFSFFIFRTFPFIELLDRSLFSTTAAIMACGDKKSAYHILAKRSIGQGELREANNGFAFCFFFTNDSLDTLRPAISGTLYVYRRHRRLKTNDALRIYRIDLNTAHHDIFIYTLLSLLGAPDTPF